LRVTSHEPLLCLSSHNPFAVNEGVRVRVFLQLRIHNTAAISNGQSVTQHGISGRDCAPCALSLDARSRVLVGHFPQPKALPKFINREPAIPLSFTWRRIVLHTRDLWRRYRNNPLTSKTLLTPYQQFITHNRTPTHWVQLHTFSRGQPSCVGLGLCVPLSLGVCLSIGGQAHST